jgi:hypothetical protein
MNQQVNGPAEELTRVATDESTCTPGFAWINAVNWENIAPDAS